LRALLPKNDRQAELDSGKDFRALLPSMFRGKIPLVEAPLRP